MFFCAVVEMKPVVETTPRVEIKQLRAQRAWTDFVAAGAVDLTLGKGKEIHMVRIELDSDPMPRGGVRHWLICPRCQARRRHLYCLGEYQPGERMALRCRVCLRLPYLSWSLPDTAWRRKYGLLIMRAWSRSRRSSGCQSSTG